MSISQSPAPRHEPPEEKGASLSPNTQAILLLTAPLLIGKMRATPDLLSSREYQHLARYLLSIQREPADLLSAKAEEVIHRCAPVVEEERLRRLLGRSFLLSQAVERWQTRALWVISRADVSYPRRLKMKMREEAPPILYGCGDLTLLNLGGLAVVGPRSAEEPLLRYAEGVGRLAANAGKMVISGGARGVDQAAMYGALGHGGQVVGVLAENLERSSMSRENRNMLIKGDLVLVSEYDPNAGFNTGHALKRNKLIYAFADAALVVNSDINKGGTWAGAQEQLDKLHFVPVYVRASGERSKGIDALRLKGALPWPEPSDPSALIELLDRKYQHNPQILQAGLPLSPEEGESPRPAPPNCNEKEEETGSCSMEPFNPANELFTKARELLVRLLREPLSEADVVERLQISIDQAQSWLSRLVREGTVERKADSGIYSVVATKITQ